MRGYIRVGIQTDKRIIESELESVKKNLDLWKGKYRSLKKEFEEYKEKHP